MVTQSQLEEALRGLVQEFQPDETWLRGCHARRAATQNSDVDQMMIGPSSKERPVGRLRRAYRGLRGLGFPKDLLVHTRAKADLYKPLGARLFHQVLTPGRTLHG